jgi:D-alanyl-lipoteichoic acid acyltransferase DltB (MBOAT superfamily)
VSGLWHGASYNYVIWGVYMGLVVGGYRLLKGTSYFATRQLPWAVGTALTYASVTLGDVFFAMDERHARFALGRIFGLF